MQNKTLGELTEEERATLNAKLGRSSFGKMMKSVGRYADEAEQLFSAIHNVGFSKAIKHIRDNPPSPECVALLAYVASDVLTSESMRARGRASHTRNDDARDWITAEWEKAGRPPRGKAQFVRDNIDTMNAKFKTDVDERTVRDRWLKTTAPHAMRGNQRTTKK